MSTLALKTGVEQAPVASVAPTERAAPFSVHAAVSAVSMAFFLTYIIGSEMDMIGVSSPVRPFFAVLFIVGAPVLALISSATALRQGIKMKLEMRGMTLAYISFFLSALFFVTALAMPIVLFGGYLVYAYIW